MYELLLMRHAKSDWNSHTSDIDRPLNARGRNDALRMGKHLYDNALIPDRMIVSAAQRTQETAELLLDSLPVKEENIIVDRELYLASSETLCESIALYAQAGQRTLILAHNPGMDDVVSYLSRTPAPLSSSGKLMTTCAVACLQMATLDALKKSRQCSLLHLFRADKIVTD